MKQFKRLFGGLIVALSLLLTGCDEIYECLANINPEIHNKRLYTGVVDEDYFDVITAEVRNEVFDNDYIYNFDVFGEIPPGLDLDFRRRSIEIYGIPEEPGVYRFEVELSVETYDEYGYDGSPTCSESTTRRFELRVVD